MPKQTVITIHGVNPDRGWQQRIEKVLSPHFECKSLTYREYDTILGPVQAVSSIYFIVAAITCIVISIYLLLIGRTYTAMFFPVLAAILLAGSFPAALWRRSRTADKLKRMLNEAKPYGKAHIIAHSLGTYLVGNALKRYPDLEFGRVLLVSAVLPETYPWDKVLKNRPGRVGEVRNEFGTSDSVTKMVGRLGPLTRDMGASGARGFQEHSNWVHTIPAPFSACKICVGEQVKVHNVALEEFAHSSVFLGLGHARKLWLPFLWGINPSEFLDFIEACEYVAEKESDGLLDFADERLTKLRTTVFSFTGGRTLELYTDDLLERHLGRLRMPALPRTETLDEVLQKLPSVVSNSVGMINDESIRDNHPGARDLHPLRAITASISFIIKQSRAES